MRTETTKTQKGSKADPVSSQRMPSPQFLHPVLQLQQQLGNQGAQRLLQSGHIQAKLTTGQADDIYEQQADRVADQVMRMPEAKIQRQVNEPDEEELDEEVIQAKPLAHTIAPVIQRRCPGCEQEFRRQPLKEGELLQTKKTPGQKLEVSNKVENQINNLHAVGQPLSTSALSFLEPRFGRDFSHVRIHTDNNAAQLAQSINARAFTVGHDIVFGSGEYKPRSFEGRRLIAHELTHVVQQSGIPGHPQISTSDNQPRLARKWKIEHPNARVPAGGRRDKALLLDAFKDICNLAQLVTIGGDSFLKLGAGSASANRTEGCGCLQTVENDVTELEAGRPSVLQQVPTIELVPNGWSFTNPSANRPKVGARHPVDPFSWGYWTPGDTRQLKPFFRTVAHEVCGHMVPFILGIPSGRGAGRGHNEAIIRENRIAAEHNVPAAQQRGLDVSEGGVQAGVHRGESFIQASLQGFAHNSATPPAGLTEIIRSAIGTIRHFVGIQGDRIRVQLEGFAFVNESTNMNQQRIDAVKQQLTTEFNNNNISLNFTPPGQAQPVSRFAADITRVIFTYSRPQTSNPERKVNIILFHRAHSAGP